MFVNTFFFPQALPTPVPQISAAIALFRLFPVWFDLKDSLLAVVGNLLAVVGNLLAVVGNLLAAKADHLLAGVGFLSVQPAQIVGAKVSLPAHFVGNLTAYIRHLPARGN